MPGRLSFDFSFSKSQHDRSASQRSHGPMRILLMGDFSGRSSRGMHESGDNLAKRPIMPVDIDNLNATMSRMAPQLHLSMGNSTESDVVIDFAQLNDFHPDHLYSKLELFQILRALRVRLDDATTFSQAADDLQRVVQTQRVAQPTGAIAGNEYDAGGEDAEDVDAMFERLLGKQQGMASPSGGRQTEAQAVIRELIKGVVEPYIVPDAEPFQAQYIAAVDEAISEQMRAVLHHPEFQALEALWRSVHTLASGLETGEDLKLYLLDISKYELEEDIKMAQDQLEHSQLYHLLVESGAATLGGEPWSVIVGNYTFTTDIEDLSLLASMGAISSQAGGPFIAAADASLLGCKSVVNTPDPKQWQYENKEAEQNWLAIRQSEVAAWIGLAHPRVLLRQPYGKKSDVLDNFDFEELKPDREHETFLWGNPAFTCALLIGQAYQTAGWSMKPGDILDVPDLPAYSYEEDGEMTLMPCAEAYLTDRAADAMLDRGLMSLVSYRHRNAVHLMRFQSVAEPNTALAGPWA